MENTIPFSFARHVPQRSLDDCGIAVVATLVGESYEKTERFFARAYNKTSSIDSGTLADALVVMTGLTVQMSRPLRPFFSMTATGAYLLQNAPGLSGHWVAMIDGRVFDPDAKRPTRLERYAGRERLVLRFVGL